MNISAISGASSAYQASSSFDTQLQSLQQQLTQLRVQKLQATDSGDTDLEKQIEKQIEALEKQIQQLKNQSSASSQPADAAQEAQQTQAPALGQIIDTYA